jgi:hypothetical protein
VRPYLPPAGRAYSGKHACNYSRVRPTGFSHKGGASTPRAPTLYFASVLCCKATQLPFHCTWLALPRSKVFA